MNTVIPSISSNAQNAIIDNNNESISITWHVDDVLEQCPTLNRDEALDVLHTLKHRHNATIGINWEVIEIVAQSCYPKKFEELDETDSWSIIL